VTTMGAKALITLSPCFNSALKHGDCSFRSFRGPSFHIPACTKKFFVRWEMMVKDGGPMPLLIGREVCMFSLSCGICFKGESPSYGLC